LARVRALLRGYQPASVVRDQASTKEAALFGQTTARDASPRVLPEGDNVQSGLGRLVLALVELIRKLMERQVSRRVKASPLFRARSA
jgi:hypothetical protein